MNNASGDKFAELSLAQPIVAIRDLLLAINFLAYNQNEENIKELNKTVANKFNKKNNAFN